MVAYIRVSTAEQGDSGLRLAAQEAAIRAECARRGWTLAALYSATLCGKTLARPGLAEALDAVESGTPAGIIVAKLDRLARSLVDIAGLMARAQAGGWNLVALDLEIDLATPAGEFMANVLASAAQWERRIIGQRTRDTLAVKRSQGVAGIGATFVFLRAAGIRKDADLKQMTADEQRNVLIVELDIQMGVGPELQRFTTMELVLIGLGSDLARRGQAPSVVSNFIRGVLIMGGFRSQRQLNQLSADDMRSILIVELTAHSDQTDYQRYNDAELAGMGAVMAMLRTSLIRDDDALRAMSADDQRNVLIVELDAQTGLGPRLQGVGIFDLVLCALGLEPA